LAILDEITRTNQSIRRQHAKHHDDHPILRVDHLTIHYESGDALADVSFELPRAIRLAGLGPNGAGKSTLLKVIAGVLQPTRGSVHVFGEAPGQHICIAYVPQRSQVDWNFPVSVRDVIMMGRIGKLGLLRRPGRADRSIVERALAVVNLSHLANRQISELSGGQQQRMFIARALAQEAEIMLMDEPLTGLDVNSQEDILNILDSLREQRVTVLVALHDLKLAAEHFDSVMLLNHRLVGLGSPAEVFSKEHLAEAYGSHRFPLSLTDGSTGETGPSWLPLDDGCCDEDDHIHG
jgi:manganese/iron transport system ATP-binding protein